jgi:hypothetical protein
MMRHWKYLKYVLRHKWFVFVAGLRLGVPIWLLIFHDWDKFTPFQWRAYADYFYGGYVPLSENPTARFARSQGVYLRTLEDVQRDFNDAWNRHQKRNRHHWQYWLLVNDNRDHRYSEQSMDGGMTHSILRIKDGEKYRDVAFFYEFDGMPHHKPLYADIRQTLRDLSFAPAVLPMPDAYRREMLADWKGAGRANGNKTTTQQWYLERRYQLILHPDTRAWVEDQLGLSDTDGAAAAAGRAGNGGAR